ncbi:Bifunctional protein HldE [subsurface metagenome]
MDWKLRREDDRYEIYDLELRDFTLSTTSLKQGKATMGNRHKHEEAYCFIKGYGKIALDGVFQQVTAGDIIIVPSDTHHQVFNEECLELYFLCVFKRRKVVVAGKFDPLHGGHKSHIEEAAKLGDRLIVITHPDDVVAKTSAKGFCYQPLAERVAVLRKELPCIGEIVIAEDEGGTVARTLKRIKPTIFAKGGDRTPDNMPKSEIDACREMGCDIIYGVGGEKVESSSKLVGKMR